MKTSPIVALYALLAGCATSTHHFGDTTLPELEGGERTFRISAHTPADEAVRNALLQAGWRENPHGGYNIEAGFAIAPPKLSLNRRDPDDQPPYAWRGSVFSFCKKQAYVLTLVFVAPQSGRIAARSGARLVRCGARSSELLPVLARSALPFNQVALRQQEDASKNVSR